VRYLTIACLALSTVACSEGETVLPSPAAVITAANAVCGTQITSLALEVNAAGPYFVIEVGFAGPPQPIEIVIERYLSTGQTEPVATLTNISGSARVDLAFNTKYRARARAGTCDWSPWVDKQVGPANPCGDCNVQPPAPPPPPPPPPPDDDEDDDEDNPCHHDDVKAWPELQSIACGGNDLTRTP
jgi:hypothetical protein